MPIPPPQLRKQPTVVGIASAAVASSEIIPTGTFYKLFLQCTDSSGDPLTQNDIETEITLIKIQVDGETVIEATPEELNMLKKFYGDYKGAGVVNGVIEIPFARNNLRLPGEISQYAWGTKGIQSIVLQIELGAVSNLSAITPFTHQTGEDRPLGPHLRIIPYTRNFGSTGLQELVDLPKTPGTGYLATHFNTPGSSIITKMGVRVDGLEAWQEFPDEVVQSYLEDHRRNPQSGYYHVCFDVWDEILSLLPMDTGKQSAPQIKELTFLPTWATAAPNTYRIVTEQVYDLR